MAALDVVPARLLDLPDTRGLTTAGLAAQRCGLARTVLTPLLPAGARLPSARLRDCLARSLTGGEAALGAFAPARLLAAPSEEADSRGTTAAHDFCAEGSEERVMMEC